MGNKRRNLGDTQPMQPVNPQRAERAERRTQRGQKNYREAYERELEYRSLRFEDEILDTDNYQGNAVVNYTEYEVPYTRIIEHKHFEYGTQLKTVITREYPQVWHHGDEPYYPMNDEKNNTLYKKYRELADKEENVIFGGRLGMYQYFDMHNIVAEALKCTKQYL